MAYDEHMVDRVRELIARRTTHVEERKMFGGLCFLVEDKICVAVKSDRMLARIDPELYEAAIEQDGCTPMARSGTNMTGYLYIDFDYLRNQNQLAYWVNLALDFNPRAKASKK